MYVAEMLSIPFRYAGREYHPTTNCLFSYYWNLTKIPHSNLYLSQDICTLECWIFFSSEIPLSRISSQLDCRFACYITANDHELRSAFFNGRIEVSPSTQDLDRIVYSTIERKSRPKNNIVHAIFSHMIS